MRAEMLVRMPVEFDVEKMGVTTTDAELVARLRRLANELEDHGSVMDEMNKGYNKVNMWDEENGDGGGLLAEVTLQVNPF